MKSLHRGNRSRHGGLLRTVGLDPTGSPIRRHHKQRELLIGLGLGRVDEVPNTRATWGMIAKVRHLIRVIDENLFDEHFLAPA
jgi:large subunit ribosomal protein L30